ncbi:DUF3164 family protein [Microbulbifer thermotolerans]|uniref:DUF3164 family protein n=1 Tax=Microbulbifer thermotolerans TaxID=252514 RepID=UPI00224B8433|nr:DUF3164 family protein [Microbulbifer thermotolerans]MCX2780607.1 DUF3164 family protein [Microbulbifer thermotolerans]MCX2783684.1 DUF3164 family protein [Microbulbifer thermotolerans]MCX2806148.1 DUF3164 family protein [Microbulbifer thermotolerans]
MKLIRWITVILYFFPIFVFGESREQFYEEYYSKNMSGWKGIVFVCSFDSNDKVLEKICERATSDIKLLAAGNKIDLKIVESNNFFEAALIASLNKFVTLEYSLTATENSGQFSVKAIQARLAFKVFYSNAVEKDAKPNTIDSIPRSGDLDLWSDTVIGFGSPSEIVHPFGNAAETHIKKALTLFIEYSG